MPILCCLDGYSFVVEAKVWSCGASHFGFLLQYYFGYSGSFVFPYTFYDCLFQLGEECWCNVIGGAYNVRTALGRIDISPIFILPIHKRGMFFAFSVSSSISFTSLL